MVIQIAFNDVIIMYHIEIFNIVRQFSKLFQLIVKRMISFSGARCDS